MRNSLLIVIALVAATGCGSADEHPLGGPYGGESNGAPQPTQGSTTGPTGTPSSGDSGTDPNGNPVPPSGNPPIGGGTDDAGDPGTPPYDAGSPSTGDDSSAPPPPPVDSGTVTPPPAAPTWTAIVNAYLKSGTTGNCGASGCHSQMNSPSSAYTWLGNKGYKGATIADPQRSPMTWYGGNMPPQGPSSNAKATADMNAWAAAGALNN